MRKELIIAGCLLLQAGAAWGQDGPQVYNMDFDQWSKSRGAWNAYAPDAQTTQKKVWDTANHGLSLLGINGTMPEYDHVAVAGPGKAAAKLVSKKVLWAFAAGNLYTGSFVRIINFSGAELTWGTPFTARPKSMSGYYHYIPKPVNYAQPPYEALKGRMDLGQIEVLLTDWDEPFHVISNNEQFVDVERDPHIIGRGQLMLTRGTDGYVRFDIPVEYRSDRTPRWVVIVAAASRYGDYFTGGNGSTLYVDEFKFNY